MSGCADWIDDLGGLEILRCRDEGFFQPDGSRESLGAFLMVAMKRLDSIHEEENIRRPFTSLSPSEADAPLRMYSLSTRVLIALPIGIVYLILLTHIVNIPIADDYDALLNFSIHLRNAPKLSDKLHYFLSSQHGEYKLFLVHALVWLELHLLGHIDLKLLSVIGNSFILLLGLLLWKMLLPRHQSPSTRMAFFVPVSWLLFQLQYAQTLNFAMAGIQNLAVLVFSLAAIYFLHCANRRLFPAAIVCLVLGISASGNGLLLVPIGLMILVLNRRYRGAAVWGAASATCIAAYLYGYDSRLWLAQSPARVPALAQFLRPIYTIGFIGSAGAYPIWAGSFVLGVAICVFYSYMVKRGYFHRNPAIGYSVLFLFLSAVIATGFRSSFGIRSSTASRYTIYSTLLLIFAWLIIVEEWLITTTQPTLRKRILVIATAGAILFSVAMDVWGFRYLSNRNRNLVTGMRLYEHSASMQSTAGPGFPAPRSKEDQAYNLWARDLLSESSKLGIYQIPPY
jgi:hypothetical protein